MKSQGTPFKGVLYAGLMVRDEHYWVLEFNARFGDPETQALLPRMEGDLIPWLMASAQGKLNTLPPNVPFVDQHACFVVTSSPGYPGTPETGSLIEGLKNWTHSPLVLGFVSGVQFQSSPEVQYLTSAGRVLGSLGLGKTAEEARVLSYRNLETIQFPQMHWRKDIGL